MQVNIKHLIDDVQCYQTVRELRWPDGVRCPSCAGIFLGWFISLLFPVIGDPSQSSCSTLDLQSNKIWR